MKQEVNLLRPELRSARGPDSMTLLLAACAVLVCVFAGVSLYTNYSARQWSERLESAKTKQEDLRQQIADLQEKVSQSPTKELREQIRKLSSERQAKQELVKILSLKGTSQQEGFAPFLRALARQRVPKLWLTSFRIDLEGEPTLRLSGQTTDSELIPDYLLRLSGESVFSGFSFRQLSANRMEERPNTVSFTLASEAE